MKYIKILILTIFLCPVFQVFSQRVVLRQTNIEQQYDIPKKGANRQQYFWVQLSLFGTDLAIGELDVKQKFGNYYGLSFNNKYKLNGVLSHGYGWGFHHQAYHLNKKGLNALSSSSWDQGKLSFAGVNINYFVRINFDPKRGNIVGTYLDLVPFGQYNFYQRAKFVEGRLTEKSDEKNFAERYAIGVETRLGREFYSIYARYKFISDNPKSDTFINLDLAKWSVGLNLNIGK